MAVLRYFKKIKQIQKLIAVLLLTFTMTGCSNKFFDPTQIGRFRPTPAINIILDSLGVADETPSQWEQAEDPKPIDIMVMDTDYILGPGDTVRIDIMDLFREGARYVNDMRISETGKISIPQVGTVEAGGLTEAQLEDQIKQILTPTIIKEPLVTVALMQTQTRIYTILGQAVPAPGRYPIPRHDYRISEALALARVSTQFNVSYAYVTRAVTGKEALTEMLKQKLPVPEPEKNSKTIPEQIFVPKQEMLEIIAPRADRILNENKLIITSSEMVTNEELTQIAMPQGFELSTGANKNTNTENKNDYDDQTSNNTPQNTKYRETIQLQPQEDTRQIEWIFQDGKWIPFKVGPYKPKKPEPKIGKIKEFLPEQLPQEFDWDQAETAGLQTRVIKIPTDKLAGGDPRYNIVIRPGDTIHVPVDIIGEYFIWGNSNASGAIQMTGRSVTLKMAIAAAGGLSPLAWPKRVEITRRIAKNREETVMVDLDKIASGEQPDFFIKPLDLINIGTHPTARWRAVLRNAFRATYGFGFIYDRNFGDRDFGTSRPIPNFITDLF